jgi:cellulose synthase/poly-beta-1,6-N-acetylglucosamine synthase-like glycosyltransferase
MTELFWSLLHWFNYVVLAYFTFVNLTYGILTVVAIGGIRRYSRRFRITDSAEVLRSAGAPPITIIVPAHNEEKSCVETVRSMLSIEYPELEIIVVDDGSEDRTLDHLWEAFSLEWSFRAPTSELPHQPVTGTFRSRKHPNLWVIAKENGGPADALNAGLNLSHAPLVCRTDADSIMEFDSLTLMARPFLEDTSTVAAGGIVRVANGCRVESGRIVEAQLPRSLLARFQVLEYLRSFYAARTGWGVLGTTLVVSGACGLFRKSVLIEAGGFLQSSITEDMELTIRLHRHCLERGGPYRIAFLSDTVLWTEVPERLGDLGRQRDRWQRGLIDLMWRHRVMFLNPRYGRVGLAAFPYLLLVEVLGPLVEFVGYFAFLVLVLFGDPSPLFIAAYLLLVFGTGIALSIAALVLQERLFRRYRRPADLTRLFALSILEIAGQRQILTYFRFKGTLSFLLRRKDWGEMERKGFEAHGSRRSTATAGAPGAGGEPE